MRIQVFPQQGDIDPEEQRRVREFLVKSFKHEAANWPENIHCTLFVDGKSARVVRGSNYQLYNGKDLYVGHTATEPPPPWVPGVLIAIAFFFQLNSDPEIIGLSVDLLARVLSDAIRPYQRLLAQAFNGMALEELAIDAETKVILAKFPALEIGAPDRWVATNGEEHQLGPSHYIFPVPERS